MIHNVPYTCGWIIPFGPVSENEVMETLMQHEDNLMTLELAKMEAEQIEKE